MTLPSPRGPSGDSRQQQPDPPVFPLTVDPFRHGWCITVHLEQGHRWRLLKPGWTWEVTEPYVFESPGEAWDFLRKIFQFCTRQQNPYNDKLCNCQFCGKVYRGRFLTACEDCTSVNDNLMEQICQGLYFVNGSYDDMILHLAMLLNMSPDRLASIKSAYALMVNDEPRFTDPWQTDEAKSDKPRFFAGRTSQRSMRKRQYGLGSRD